MTSTIKRSAPFDIYYNKVKGCLDGGNVIEFKDLLEEGLEEAFHFTYIWDYSWLIKQYREKFPSEASFPQIRVVYDHLRNDIMAVLRLLRGGEDKKLISRKATIDGANNIKMHSNLCIFKYKTHIKIAILSANLYDEEWDENNAAIWWSPALPLIKEEEQVDNDEEEDLIKNDSITYFKRDLLKFLNSLITCYQVDEIIENAVSLIRRADMSELRVMLLASSPNTKARLQKKMQIHFQMNKKNVEDDEIWDVISQSSSISQDFLAEFFIKILQCSPKTDDDKINLIFPSTANVDIIEKNKKGLFFHSCGEDLPYSIMRRWKADKLKRTGYTPHHSFHYKMSIDSKKVAWFIFTTANISRAAWGEQPELGVAFLPKFFDRKYFDIDEVPIMFDLPLTPYETPITSCYTGK